MTEKAPVFNTDEVLTAIKRYLEFYLTALAANEGLVMFPEIKVTATAAQIAQGEVTVTFTKQLWTEFDDISIQTY